MGFDIGRNHVVELSEDRCIIFKNDQFSTVIRDEYGQQHIEDSPRCSFTASISHELSFPQEELSRAQVQDWFDAREKDLGIAFLRPSK